MIDSTHKPIYTFYNFPLDSFMKIGGKKRIVAVRHNPCPVHDLWRKKSGGDLPVHLHIKRGHRTSVMTVMVVQILFAEKKEVPALVPNTEQTSLRGKTVAIYTSPFSGG